MTQYIETTIKKSKEANINSTVINEWYSGQLTSHEHEVVGAQFDIDIIDDEDLDNICETDGSGSVETQTNSHWIVHTVADCDIFFFSDVVTGSGIVIVIISKYK